MQSVHLKALFFTQPFLLCLAKANLLADPPGFFYFGKSAKTLQKKMVLEKADCSILNTVKIIRKLKYKFCSVKSPSIVSFILISTR